MTATAYYNFTESLQVPSTNLVITPSGVITTLGSIYYSEEQQACVGIKLSCIGSNAAECDNVDKITGELTIDDWTAGWSPTCIDLYGNIINGLAPNTSSVVRKFSLFGLQATQYDFQYMFSRLYNNNSNYIFTDIGKTGYNPFQEVLLDACRKLPGACQYAQNKMCKNNTYTYLTRDTIAESESLVSMCGCVAPSLESVYGEKYKDVSLECDPLCSQQLSIKPIVGDTISHLYEVNLNKDSNYATTVLTQDDYGLTATCQATICVIDSVSITASNSTTGGTSFTQVCPSCANTKGAQCKCIVNFTPTTVGNVQTSDLSNSVTFNQYCPGAVCLNINEATNVLEVVECSDHLTTTATVTPSTSIPKTFWIIIGIIIFFILLGFIILFYAKKNIKTYFPLVIPDMTKGIGPNGELSSLYI